MTGSVQKKRNKWWTVVYLGNGKYDYRNTHLDAKGNKRAADKLLREHITDMERQSGLEQKDVLFTDFMLEWLEHIEDTVGPYTYYQYGLIIKNSVIPFFEKHNVLLKDLQPLHIQKYYNQMKKDGKSANTIKHHHANIHKALKYAVQLNMIPYNPSERVELDPVKEYEGNFYTADQMKTVLELVKGTHIETAVLLAAVYGLRRSEALGVQWRSIDFEKQTLTIRHTVTVTEAKDQTKNTTSRRSLRIPPQLLGHLKEVRAKQQAMKALLGNGYFKSDYVCTWEDGKPLKPNYVSDRFKKILTEYSETHDFPVYRFHDLRHSVASLLVEEGKSLKQIGGLLGHSNPTTTNRYAHLQHQATMEMVQSVSGKLFGENVSHGTSMEHLQQKEERHPPRQEKSDVPTWCGQEDLNLHRVAPTRT